MAPVVEHSLRSIDWRLTRATERSGAYVARNSHSLPSEVGHNYAGHNCIAHNYAGHRYIGHNYIGHNYLGHLYIGNNYIGHLYVGHNYVGHN
jgi:hypothetical protein